MEPAAGAGAGVMSARVEVPGVGGVAGASLAAGAGAGAGAGGAGRVRALAPAMSPGDSPGGACPASGDDGEMHIPMGCGDWAMHVPMGGDEEERASAARAAGGLRVPIQEMHVSHGRPIQEMHASNGGLGLRMPGGTGKRPRPAAGACDGDGIPVGVFYRPSLRRRTTRTDMEQVRARMAICVSEYAPRAWRYAFAYALRLRATGGRRRVLLVCRRVRPACRVVLTMRSAIHFARGCLSVWV